MGTSDVYKIYFWPYIVQVFLEWELLQTKVVEKIKSHNLCSNNIFSKNVPILR
jgi:hypothetical protein